MKTVLKTTAAVLSAVSGIILLAGCDMATPSQVSVRQIEIRRTVKTETVDLLKADAALAAVIAKSYKGNGSGPVTITAAYKSGSGRAERDAKGAGAVWRQHLLNNGVPSVQVAAVPVSDSAHAGKAVISWSATVAAAPSVCDKRLPGLKGADNLHYARDYTVGCEVQHALSRQISNPNDLLGRAGTPGDDAKRSGILVDDYRNGVPNPPMEGAGASDIGNSAGGG